MPQQIVIAEQLRIAALLTDERVDELIVAQGRYQIGDVYLGTVENVLPGIDAAFVNIGESEKNGFIHVTDLGPLRLKKGAAGITELLEPRQKVLVQVMKEPTGTKGPRLTGNLALPGRYLVLQPHGQGVNISRRINSEGERNRLRALGVLVKPPGAGLLIRTEADGISEDLLIDDLEALLRQWEAIQQAADTAAPPVLLNRDEDFIHRVLRDHVGPDLVRVVVNDSAAVERVSSFLGQEGTNVLVEAHNEPTELLEHYRVNAAIRDALRPRVDLPSGGYVIIEPTEALTVIDVNSGSFTRSANARQTVLWTNCEAAIEIARQLKLRNIGGVIIIDFIDMESRRDQLQLLEHFTTAVRDDSARPQIAQLTELGLVELTRKRQGQNIYELFGRACPSCCGLGHVAVLPGKDLLQPLALATGLVRSTTSVRTEVQLPGDGGNGRRRRGGRVRSGGGELPGLTVPAAVANGVESTAIEAETQEHSSSTEAVSRRQEPELVAVPMDSEQEQVFGWLGLNPLLLLETPPENDNFLVRVVRPGDDAEEVLEEARQQLAASSNRRRRRG
ncbi:MAG TPA: Rne/Rng family ribonuclease, partial [Prochlorococcus sp.]